MAAVFEDAGGAAELKRMRVAPTHQASGYGSQLLEALEARAIECGYTQLILDTGPSQEAAQRLYEGHGFKQQHTMDYEVKGKTYDLLLYRKHL